MEGIAALHFRRRSSKAAGPAIAWGIAKRRFGDKLPRTFEFVAEPIKLK